MQRWHSFGLGFAGILFGISSVSSAQSFQGIGDLTGGTYASAAWGVSGDGRTVVGSSNGEQGQDAIRWTQTLGIQSLGTVDLPGGSHSATAQGASFDGSVITGTGDDAFDTEPFRWTDPTGMVGMGTIPGGNEEGLGYDISDDGRIIVGKGTNPTSEAFRAIGTGPMTGIGDLAGGAFNSRAFGISGDGNIVVGTSESGNSNSEAFRWTSPGPMQPLGDLDNGPFSSGANDADEDGDVIVGFGFSDAGKRAFRWTQANGMEDLDVLPTANFASEALAVSGDGSVIVGVSNGSNAGTETAFIWDAVNGIRDLRDVLIAAGLGAQVAGWELTHATGISSDGTVIVGRGFNPSVQAEGWVAVIPEPATGVALIAIAGGALLVRRGRVG